MVETITVTTKFVVTAVTMKQVVTAIMVNLDFTTVTTKLVVTSCYDEAGRIGILLRILHSGLLMFVYSCGKLYAMR